MKKTIKYLQDKKNNKKMITVLASYDYPTTILLEKAEIDIIILGDSVGTNILGYDNETQVTLNDMLHHTRAVKRGIKKIFLVVDMPYKTHETPREAVKNAKKLIDNGADAVKYEGIKENILIALKENNIKVMTHIGLNPQYDQEYMKQGKITKGKTFEEAKRIIEGAKYLERAGADLIILEKIPEKIAKIITENINIPTIGIGAGRYCDGQVLVINDIIGLNQKKYKHVKEYINLHDLLLDVIIKYKNDVESKIFPSEENINLIKVDELIKIKEWCLEKGYLV